MTEAIRTKDKYYILARTTPAGIESRVLKRGRTFALFDRHGDMRPFGFEDHGIYHDGTRFLSRLVFRLEDESPLLLNSAVKEENDFLLVHLTNPDIKTKDGALILKGTLYIKRSIFLLDGEYHERIRFGNFGEKPLAFSFTMGFDADYADIFEVRGAERKKRGTLLETDSTDKNIVLGYLGLDSIVRRTHIFFSHSITAKNDNEVSFKVQLEPKQEIDYTCTVICGTDECAQVQAPDYNSAFTALRQETRDLRKDECNITTSNEGFNTWLNRSWADLYMMISHTGSGLYPHAGIPWFSAIFGRDGIITAFEMLAINPDVAHGVLSYLAKNQAGETSQEQDAEPGKILHETRTGEMANLKEIPFWLYYGSVDSTPLFIILAGYYFERTGNIKFMEELWPAIELALNWINNYGDSDGDMFIEYSRHTSRGLLNQGWKDSGDAVFHSDGVIAGAPIALCEVQAYVYEAKMKASQIAFALGNKKAYSALKKEAKSLREKFIKIFWLSDLGMYALALDGEKKPCAVRSSNAGQCLFGGIATASHAKEIVHNLTGEDFFSGWGIRTIARSEPRYNPLSYHNGSVWPHDNALIAYGMARYGYKEEVIKILTGLFDASGFMQLRRLPELFCGFQRYPGEGPTLYPVACNPQAWASGSVFLLLGSCIGMSIRADQNKVYFNNPHLPVFLNEVHIKNLKVGSAVLDISLLRNANDAAVTVVRKHGDAEVIVTK